MQLGSLLRAEGQYSVGAHRIPWRALILTTLLASATYGAVMGFYAGRPIQALFSAFKVPCLLAISTIVCTPSFFVINTLLGLRDDLRSAYRGILCAQASLAVILASFAPVTELLYLSVSDYTLATLFNGLVFAIATAGAQIVLARHYRPLIAINPKHRLARRAWVFVYIFVAVQSAWVLRPFVGSPSLEPEFFREDAWSNAYVEIFRRILNVFAEID